MATDSSYSHVCKPLTPYGMHTMTRAQFREMETLIAARFDTLEKQMRQERDELAAKLDEVKLALQEVKRRVEARGSYEVPCPDEGGAGAPDALIHRIRLAESQLDAVAQLLNVDVGDETDRKDERF